jgi:hypothetical protein
MKKLKLLLTTVPVMLAILICFAFSVNAEDSDWIKNNPEDTVEYNFNEATGTIVFRGEGEIYQDYFGTPEDRAKIASKIKTVIIEDGIKEIGRYVFSGFPVLENVVLPYDFEVIDDYAFSDCKAMKKFDFNVSEYLSIGSGTFMGSGLEYVNVPSNVTLYSNTFDDCDNLKKIIFNSSWSVMTDCDSLIEIVMPADIDQLDLTVETEEPICTIAKNCKSLQKITFPAIEKINNIKIAAADYDVFADNCPNLKTISNINIGLAYFSHIDYAVVTKLNNSIKKSKIENLKFTQKGYYNSKLSWKEVDGAGYYQVLLKDGNKWKRVYSGSETEYTCRQSGEYKVRAVSYDGKTHIYGKYSTIKVNYVSIVKNVRLEGNILKWDALDNVTGYKIYYLSKDNSAVQVFGKTTKNYIDVSPIKNIRELMIRAYYKTPEGTQYGSIVYC